MSSVRKETRSQQPKNRETNISDKNQTCEKKLNTVCHVNNKLETQIIGMQNSLFLMDSTPQFIISEGCLPKYVIF